jgi:hypothetical protein
LAPKIITRPKGSEPLPLPPGLLPGTATTVPKQSSTPITVPGDTKLPPAVPNATIPTVPTTIPSKIPPTLQQKEGKLPLPPGLGITVPENAPGLGRSGMAVPKVITPPKYVTSPDLYEARRDLGQATIDTLRAGANPKTVESIVQGEPQPSGGWRGVLAKTINFDIIPGKGKFEPIKTLALGPLVAYDTGRRAGVGAFTESVEAARGLLGKTQTYKATDYIPVHPQTGMPIAKVGDPVIINERKILTTPIPGIENITTAEAALKATEDLADKYAITQKGSLSELKKQIDMDSTFGFGDIPYLQTGNKWVDRTIGLFGDLALDPTVYTSGPGALTKAGYQATVGKATAKATKEAAELAAREALKEVAPYLAAKEAADLAAKQAAEYAAKLAADAPEIALKNAAVTGVVPDLANSIRLAEEAAKAAADKAARAAADLAAREAAAATADAAAKTAAAAAATAAKTATKTATTAPRRVYGAGARETLANTVREIKAEALTAAINPSLSAIERKAAKDAALILSDKLIGDIATKGYAAITGDAAKLLGVKGGIRIGLPTLPKFTIPATGWYTNLVGKGVAAQRLWTVNTPKGAAILNRLIGTEAGSPFLGSAQQKEMRLALAQGTAKGALAADYVNILAMDKIVRGELNLIRKGAGQAINSLVTNDGVRTAKEFAKESKGVHRLIEVGAAGTPAQAAVIKDVNDFIDAFYEQANKAAKALGSPDLPRIPNYFPRMQSAAAMDWAARNAGRLNKVADDLNIDPTQLLSGNYLERQLVEGATWFGYRLTAADVAGGIDRLNQIARQYGKVKFDFFTTDVAEALTKYAENHARFMAYARLINGQTMPFDISADILDAAGNVIRREGQPTLLDVKGIPKEILSGQKPGEMELTTLARRIENLLTPDKIKTGWAPAQIQDVINQLTEIQTKLGSTDILRDEFQQAVMDLDEYIKLVDQGIADGTITPLMGTIIQSEAENFATALATQADNVRGTFLVSDKARWKSVGKMLNEGYEVLNINSIPDVAVRTEVKQIFKNLQTLNNPKVADLANQLLKDYTTLFKSTATASVGFHQRNAIGNVFMLIAAGGNPKNLVQGLKVYREFKAWVKDGKSVDSFINKFPANEQEGVANAIGLTGATGYGQFGEIAEAGGTGKTGIFGREATGLTPFAGRMVPFTGKLPSGAPKRPLPGVQVPALKTASEKLNTPFRALRKVGTDIEESTRFALLYDGIKKGYSPLEAANRVNKYLVDYSNISSVDKVAKAVVPFWMWASRNLPLQIENMWMNPKAYSAYNSLRRNLRDEESESPFVPDYLKEQGAFKIPNVPAPVNVALGAIGTGLFGGAVGGVPGAALGALTGGVSGGIVSGPDAYLNPQLGFPGAGAPNQLQDIASGDALGLLSSLIGPLRVPLEQAANQQFFSGAPIRKEGDSDQARKEATLAYWLSQLVPQAGLAGRILSAIPGDEPKVIQQITGSKLDKELQAAASYIGSPGFRLLPAQEKNEIRRRYYELQALKNRELKNNPDLPG